MPDGDVVIRVENVAKRYLVGHISTRRDGHDTLRDAIVRSTKNFARKTMDVVRGRQIIEGDAVEDFWALNDVSFDVTRGEVLGIVGANGAGKSTLLKILSRVTEPTKGRIMIRGRVASLLEVGTGFHPELSGRENVFLNGAILGMARAEIRTQFDGIVAFAGVERLRVACSAGSGRGSCHGDQREPAAKDTAQPERHPSLHPESHRSRLRFSGRCPRLRAR